MAKFNITFPIAGALHFYDVEAESREEAIEKCYEIVGESKDPMQDFDGEWEMYEKIAQGNVLHVQYNRVDVEKVDEED